MDFAVAVEQLDGAEPEVGELDGPGEANNGGGVGAAFTALVAGE